MRGLRYGSGLLLAAVWVAPLHAQEPGGTIRGRVTDEASQLPLRGATVRVGSQATPDPAGRRLSPHRGARRNGHPAGDDDRLRAGRAGRSRYRPGQALDSISRLAPQAVNLAEMVVVGYGEQRQGNVTGAVTNVTSEEFNTGRIVTPHRADPEQGGRACRWSRTPSPAARPRSGSAGRPPPTPATSRSTSSTGCRSAPAPGSTSGRDPLNFLNPDDIASITVLRDAGGGGDLRHQRGQRRGPDHDQAGRRPARSRSSSTPARRRRLASHPAALDAQRGAVPLRRRAVRARSNAGQLQNANTDWFGAIDRTGFGQEHNVAVSGARREHGLPASRSTSWTRTASSSATAPSGSAWARTTTSGSPATG